MTVTPAPEPTPSAAPPNSQQPASRDDLLTQHVHAKISRLQHAYIDGSPSAAASLAKLRRAVNVSPGSDSGIWFDTLDTIDPRLLGTGNKPSPYELAIHASVTLYATHQQSHRIRMHQLHYPLGRSVRLLAKRVSSQKMTNDNPVMRRFHAVGTASSLSETLHYLRGLITQLRVQAIPLEYGQLAQDLRRLQNPRTATSVRMQWGRDYHRMTAGPPDPSSSRTDESSNHDSQIGDTE